MPEKTVEKLTPAYFSFISLTDEIGRDRNDLWRRFPEKSPEHYLAARDRNDVL